MPAAPLSSLPRCCLRVLEVAGGRHRFSPLNSSLRDAIRGPSVPGEQELRASCLCVDKQPVQMPPVGLGGHSALISSRYSSSAGCTHGCSSKTHCFCSSCSAFLSAASALAVSEGTGRSLRTFTTHSSSPSSSRSGSSHSSIGEKPASAEKSRTAGGSTKTGGTSPAAASSHAKRISGLHKLCDLKGPLVSFMGKAEASRIEVIKRVWEHIKRHNLQSAENKKMINADHALKPILQKDQVSMFEMNKLLNKYVQNRRPVTSVDTTHRDA